MLNKENTLELVFWFLEFGFVLSWFWDSRSLSWVKISAAYIQAERCYCGAWTVRIYMTLYLNLILRIYLFGFYDYQVRCEIINIKLCWGFFCSASLGFLRDLCEVLLYILLPPGDFQNKIMRYFVRVSMDSKSHSKSLV